MLLNCDIYLFLNYSNITILIYFIYHIKFNIAVLNNFKVNGKERVICTHFEFEFLTYLDKLVKQAFT